MVSFLKSEIVHFRETPAVKKLFTQKSKSLGITLTQYLAIAGVHLASIDNSRIDIFLRDKYLIELARKEAQK